MNTLYTDVELTTTLEKGFYGHPNIGAAVFNCVRDSFLDVHNSVFMEALVQDLNALPQGEHVRLYLFGSLFGGTGASVTPNLVDVCGPSKILSPTQSLAYPKSSPLVPG